MTLNDLVCVARQGARVQPTPEVEQQISQTRKLIEHWVEAEETIYGVTTGFGLLSDVTISKEDTQKLQENILMSHAAGVGDIMEPEAVRAMMLLRVKDLARGHSGIRIETFNSLINLLNSGIVPVVPEKGSVGASGDLCPLAHLSLVLIGKGEAIFDGKRMPGKDALSSCGIEPIVLEAGEGLALVNGTQAMTAIGGLSVFDASLWAAERNLIQESRTFDLIPVRQRLRTTCCVSPETVRLFLLTKIVPGFRTPIPYGVLRKCMAPVMMPYIMPPGLWKLK
jgi:histidine ammonia-lyase